MPDYSLPEEDELFQKTATAKRKKRGLRKKDKEALGLTGRRGTAREGEPSGRNPPASPGGKLRQAAFFSLPVGTDDGLADPSRRLRPTSGTCFRTRSEWWFSLQGTCLR